MGPETVCGIDFGEISFNTKSLSSVDVYCQYKQVYTQNWLLCS